MEFTVVVTEAPYGRERAYTALRFALTALVEGHRVNIFLIQDGVYVARKGQSPSEFPSFVGYLEQAVKEGAKVKICSVCVKARGLDPADFIENTELGDMHDLTRWVSESDRVITF